MNLDSPFALVTPTLDGDVLGLLARTEDGFSPSEIQRQLGHGSVQGIRNVLVRLVNQGIVVGEPIGGGSVYSLRTEHLAAPYLVALAHVADEICERISDQISLWRPAPRFACLIPAKPVSSGSPDPLQLLIVAPDELDEVTRQTWTSQVGLLRRRVFEWSGTNLNVRQVDVAGLARAMDKCDPVIERAASDGRVLFGRHEFLQLAALEIVGDDDQQVLLDRSWMWP